MIIDKKTTKKVRINKKLLRVCIKYGTTERILIRISILSTETVEAILKIYNFYKSQIFLYVKYKFLKNKNFFIEFEENLNNKNIKFTRINYTGNLQSDDELLLYKIN